MFLPFLLAIGGIALAVYGYRQLDALKRYDFEHRTAGGVVEHQSYESAKAHNRAKENAVHFQGFGVAGAVIGLIWFVIAMMISTGGRHR